MLRLLQNTHLLAVLVIIDAGQGLVRVAVEIRVLPTHVAVASPAHVALKKEEIRGLEEGKRPGRTDRCPWRYPLHPPASLSSCPPRTAQEISPFLSNTQTPLMSQGLEVEVLQDFCGMQPDV